MATVIVTILIFLVMVSLHEFGHFIMAKACGIKVLEFAVGMGPAIFKKQKGETLYSVRIFPIGGYCKMEGEDGASDDKRAFTNQVLWKRFLVTVAGATLNVILGFVIFLILVANTSPFSTTTVDTVVEHSYLAQSGIQSGDEIVKINGKTVTFFRDISLYCGNLKEDEAIPVQVKRAGQRMEFEVKPSKEVTTAKYTQTGVEYINALNGVQQTNFYPYDDTLPKDETKIGKEETQERLLIGFTPTQENVTIFNIIPQAFYNTKFVVKLVYTSLFQMITGQVSLNQVAGPVGIVSEVNTAVNSGAYSWLNVLSLVALLTINLGIFNLLPIPALDGGRIFFMLIELIRRKPIPPEKEGMIHAIGLLVLFGLIIVISFNDILRLFRG